MIFALFFNAHSCFQFSTMNMIVLKEVLLKMLTKMLTNRIKQTLVLLTLAVQDWVLSLFLWKQILLKPYNLIFKQRQNLY